MADESIDPNTTLEFEKIKARIRELRKLPAVPPSAPEPDADDE